MAKGKKPQKTKRLSLEEKRILSDKLHNKLTPEEWQYLNKAIERKIEDAKEEATDEGAFFTVAIIFMALRDKNGFSVFQLQRLWKQVGYYSSEIADGRIKMRDITNMLKEEADITFEPLLSKQRKKKETEGAE